MLTGMKLPIYVRLFINKKKLGCLEIKCLGLGPMILLLEGMSYDQTDPSL